MKSFQDLREPRSIYTQILKLFVRDNSNTLSHSKLKMKQRVSFQDLRVTQILKLFVRDNSNTLSRHFYPLSEDMPGTEIEAESAKTRFRICVNLDLFG